MSSELRELARKVAKESIVTSALARMLEQVLLEVYETKIKPLEVENALLKARLRQLGQKGEKP